LPGRVEALIIAARKTLCCATAVCGPSGQTIPDVSSAEVEGFHLFASWCGRVVVDVALECKIIGGKISQIKNGPTLAYKITVSELSYYSEEIFMKISYLAEAGDGIFIYLAYLFILL